MLSPNFYTKVVEETQTFGSFIIDPLPLSFGQSMGNAFRRVLLSSLEGAAITHIKIEGAPHLFSTIKGVKESALEIALNLKQLRFEPTTQTSFRIKLNAKTKGKVYAKDLDSEVPVVNADLYIAEITDVKGKLELEAVGEIGIGYISAEEQPNKETGYVSVDSFFSPVKKVNFKVEEARVGRKTNFDRLSIDVTTDGSISPKDAFKKAAGILSEFFGFVMSGKDLPQTEEVPTGTKEDKPAEIDKKLYEVIIDELNLPSRVINALLRENIETVADLIKAGREKLTNMKGVGKKSIELIEEELKKMGISLD